MKNLSNISKFNPSYLLMFWLLALSYFSCTENRISCVGDEDCPNCLVCDQGNCVDLCEEVECPEAYICYKGTCVFIGECKDVYCPPGKACYMGQCYRFETE